LEEQRVSAGFVLDYFQQQEDKRIRAEKRDWDPEGAGGRFFSHFDTAVLVFYAWLVAELSLPRGAELVDLSDDGSRGCFILLIITRLSGVWLVGPVAGHENLTGKSTTLIGN
jgi:hypothetical protein